MESSDSIAISAEYEDLLLYHYHSNLAFAMEGVLLCVVGAVGLVGNATAIAVFSRQRVQRNFHALMVGLAVFDATYIIMRCVKRGFKPQSGMKQV